VERVADVVLVEDHLVPTIPAPPGQLCERAETLVVHMREQCAPAKSVDRQGEIGHAGRFLLSAVDVAEVAQLSCQRT
jgi:hypothetical protein